MSVESTLTIRAVAIPPPIYHGFYVAFGLF